MSSLTPSSFILTNDDFQARLEAEKLDLSLGFNIDQIEADLLKRAQSMDPQGSHKTWGQTIHQGNQTWVGLSHQTLQTPYSELHQMCELLDLKANSTVVDLGAGYGRLGLILATFYPSVRFLGLEYVKERVAEGSRIYQKLQCKNAELIVQDLGEEGFQLPKADFYLLYDYGTLTHMRRTLGQFESLADKNDFTLVARGKGVRHLIHYEHSWLTNLCTPIHRENFSIYSTSEKS